MAIDRAFLEDLEGFEVTPYIPKSNGKVLGKSGVTVGTGIDIGQMNMREFLALPLADDVKSLLAPYVGKKGESAAQALAKNPLPALPADQLRAADDQVLQKSTERMAKEWGPDWANASNEQQTAVMSLVHQFGWPSAKKFNTVKNILSNDPKDIVAAQKELRNPKAWGKASAYQTRRGKEADLLSNYLQREATQPVEVQSQRINAGPLAAPQIPAGIWAEPYPSEQHDPMQVQDVNAPLKQNIWSF